MKGKAIQYTIRNVPPRVDRALRTSATARSLSLNALILRALEAEAGVGGEPLLHHDLDGFFGSWVDDRKVDAALAAQRRVDPRDWK